MNRLKSHAHDNGSIRTDNRGILPLLPILIALLIGGGMALVAWAFFAELWISTMIFIVIFLFIWMMIKGMEQGIVGKRGMVLGTILILIFMIMAVVVAPIAFQIGGLGAETDTDSRAVHAFKGYGNFPDLEGDAHKYGEVYDGTKALTSWLSDGKSQKIVIQPKLKAGRQGEWGGWACSFYDHRYRFEINTGSGFKSFKNDATPNGEYTFTKYVSCTGLVGGYNWFDLPAFVLRIDGPMADGAVLRVWYEGYISDKWEWLSLDDIVLRSGIPTVEWGAKQYAIGDNAVLRTEIPFVEFDEGGTSQYFLSVINQNDGSTCKDSSGRVLNHVAIESTYKTWYIPVTDKMFVVSENCQNRLRAVISNEILNADMDDVSIINIAGMGPIVEWVRSDEAEYSEGDTVKIDWKAKPNPDTGTPISKYHMTAQIGGLILYDDDLNDTEASFIAPTSGFLEVEVTAYDELCRPSAIYEITLEVGNIIPGMKKKGGIEGMIPWILIIVMLIWAIAGAWIYYDKKFPGTTKTKLIVILAGFAIIALAFFMEWIPYG